MATSAVLFWLLHVAQQVNVVRLPLSWARINYPSGLGKSASGLQPGWYTLGDQAGSISGKTSSVPMADHTAGIRKNPLSVPTAVGVVASAE